MAKKKNKRNTKKRAAKKHAAAVKRRKQVKRKQAVRPDPPRPAAPPASAAARDVGVPRFPSAPRPWRLWDPTQRPPTLPRLPEVFGIDALVAVTFGDHRVAICVPTPDGLIPSVLRELPPEQDVIGLGDHILLEEPRVEEVWWLDPPRRVGDVVRCTLVVHNLTEGEDGLTWAPVVSVTIGPHGAFDAVVVGGNLYIDDGSSWGSFDTHAQAVYTFLEAHADLFRRVQEGGPGLDAGWRLDGIRGASPRYKSWVVDDLIAHADEMVPALLGVLDEVLADTNRGDSDDWGPVYALVTLVHLGVEAAHPRLLALARMSEGAFEAWFGTFLTEGFGAALHRTAGGDVAGIRALLHDVDASGWIRGQAARALAFAVVEGVAERDAVVAELAAVLAKTDAGHPTAAEVASVLVDLRAVAHEQAIVVALAQDEAADAVSRRLHSAAEPVHGIERARSADPHVWLERWAWYADAPPGVTGA